MKKTVFQILCLFVLALSYLLVFTTGKSQAQPQPNDDVETKTESKIESKTKALTHSFPGVAVFTTSSGRFGFFEQGTGRIFVYDGDLSDCVFKGQLSELGEPIEKVE